MAIDGVLRIKGLVAIDGRAAPLAVQAVGPRVETWFVPDDGPQAGAVVIGLKGLGSRRAVERRRLGGAARQRCPRRRCRNAPAEGPAARSSSAPPSRSILSSRRATSSSSPPPTRRSPALPLRGARSASDFPSVRLANWMALAHPYSVDLYGEKVLAHAKLVVVRLLGGASYWRYGLDEAVRLARANSSAARRHSRRRDLGCGARGARHGVRGRRAKALGLSRRGRLGESCRMPSLLRSPDRRWARAARREDAAERRRYAMAARESRARTERSDSRDRLLPRADASGADGAGRCALRGACRSAGSIRFRSTFPA